MNPNCHIAILKSKLNPQGGLEKHANKIIKALRQKEHRLTILTTDTEDGTQKDPFLKFIKKNSTTKLSFLKVREFDRFCLEHLKKDKPDIVLGLDRNTFQTHMRAGNGVHAAYLDHRAKSEGYLKNLFHTLNPLHRTLLQFEKKGFENPLLQKVITNSKMVKDEILDFYRVDPNKIYPIHNAVEWQDLKKPFQYWQEKKPQIASSLGLDPSTFHFLFVGHNYKRKGLKNLLHALSLIRQEPFHLSIVGKDRKMHDFKNLCQNLGLDKKVTFFGPCSDLVPFYQLADSLIIPSFYDPFANATVEALAMGVFVVSSSTNGGCEVLSQENGLIIESMSSYDSIAQALKEALTRPKTLSSAVAIRNSIQHLDFSKQMPLLMDLILS